MCTFRERRRVCIAKRHHVKLQHIKFIISNYPQSTLEHNLRGVTIRALSPSVKKWNSTFACHSLRKGSSTCSCFWYIPSQRMTSPLGAKGKSRAPALALYIHAQGTSYLLLSRSQKLISQKSTRLSEKRTARSSCHTTPKGHWAFRVIYSMQNIGPQVNALSL